MNSIATFVLSFLVISALSIAVMHMVAIRELERKYWLNMLARSTSLPIRLVLEGEARVLRMERGGPALVATLVLFYGLVAGALYLAA